jgi:adenylate kinase
VNVLMLAPPGGGKGTQGTRLAAALGLEHISSGDALRAQVAADTPLGREVAAHVAAGRLAPDALVTQAVLPALDGLDGYVLDAFPRTLAQTAGLDFDAVFYLDVPVAALERRLLARGRQDDVRVVIAQRLQQYVEETRPLIEHYRALGVLHEVDGDRPADEVAADLVGRLKG